jgi:LuxR family transcriptional regulator, maltose regulon positive regulatory protein
MTYATAILFTSDRRDPQALALLQTPLQFAEERWRAEENRDKLGEALALRALAATLQGDWAAGFGMARQALALLPQGETQWRANTLPLVAMEELLSGALHATRQTLTQALELSRAARNVYGTLVTALSLGDVCTAQAELQRAAEYYRQVLAEAEQAPINKWQAHIRIGGARLGLSALALAWNDLPAAERDASDAVAIGGQVAYEELRAQGSFILARIKHLRGETAEAQHMLHALAAQPPPQRWLFLLGDTRAYQARLALAVGDVVAAERLITRAPVQSGGRFIRLQQEQQALLVARLRIAQGRPEEALRALEHWQAEAHAQGRVHSELEIGVLQALAHSANRDPAQAKAALLPVLTQARTEGYRRLFLDEGEPLATLLRALWLDVKDEPPSALPSAPLAAYVRSLLIAFVQEHPEPADAPAASAAEVAFLVEPLSAQERRVLHLLVAGLSNAEMARQLNVSVNTVKTQVQSIYRKLNVSSRQQACDVARQLDLA